MTPTVFFKKAIRRIGYEFLAKFIFNEPMLGLKFLHRFRLDIKYFVIPFFNMNNKFELKRLKTLRSQGYDPAIIYFAVESDGRFDRLHEISKSDSNVESVWFAFPKQCAITEALIFDSYNKQGCGFYEDARMKYIHPDNDENRSNYRKYLRDLFCSLEDVTGPIDFFLSGSNHDRYVVEMVTVAQERGISWIVAEREGTGTNFSYKYEAECFKESKCVTADYFFTANAGHKYMFDFSKKDSVKDVFIIGELDTDWWFHWDRHFKRKEYRQWDHYSKKVLFLTFGIRNYLEPYAFPNNPEFNWIELLKEAEDEIFEFALNHRDVLVFYKMGHLEDNNPEFIERCRKHNLVNVIPLDRSFPCEELILYSDLVIGFQSTAMFEAMFSNKPLFYLDWAIPEGIDKNEMMLPVARDGACTRISSKSNFNKMLKRWYSEEKNIFTISSEMEVARKSTREIMFNNADGYVAERAWSKIEDLINLKKSNKNTETDIITDKKTSSLAAG